MGLFSKIKSMFSKVKETEEEEQVTELENEEEVEKKSEEIEEEISEPEVEETVEEEVYEESPVEEESVVEEVVEKTEIEEPAEEQEEDIVEEKPTIEEEIEEPEEAEEEVPQVDIKKAKVYEKGLTKTRKSFVSSLLNLTNKYAKINEDYFDELEEILIMADIGVNTVMKFMDRLRDRVIKEKITNPEDLKEVIVDELFIIYVNDDILENKIHYAESGPTVLLFIGVNGVGKTTTIGKLSHQLIEKGKKVLLVAGDTFRAGATKQLEEWANRVGAGFIGKEEGADPASVVFDGIEKAKKENYDVVMIDTAGRLQNKVNLMNELEKINRVISREIPEAPHETLLIIDATTGQNGISQAKSFKEITNITGIVLTKLDGTAKGGIVLAIKEEVDIPVKYIGLGETKDDLQVFDIEDYIYGLFKDMM